MDRPKRTTSPRRSPSDNTQRRDYHTAIGSAGVIRSADTPMILHARVVCGNGGGPDKTIFRSARYLDPSRGAMAGAYIHPHDDPGIELLRVQARDQGFPLWEVPESGPLDPGTIRSLIQLCKKLRVTVWHSHDYKTDLLGLLLRRWLPIKLVATVHGWTNETVRTRFYYHVDQWCIKRYDQVIAVSPKLVDHCQQLGVDPERLTYIPNAIEVEDYGRYRTPAAARADMEIAADRVILGTVGRLSKEKGVDRAISTLARIRRDIPTAELHIIGDGPQRSDLESLSKKLGVADGVRFWGWQPQVNHFYEIMDLLLMPSHTEGLPNVALEAMAIGVPVAATDVGAVRELLDDGRCGVILDPLDIIGWDRQIIGLLTNTPRRLEIAGLARRHIAQHFSFRQRMKQVLGVYEALLGHPMCDVADAERRAA